MNNTKNISFTSRIYFLPANDFHKIWKSKMRPDYIVDEPWGFAQTKFSKNWLGTSAINTCTSLNLAKSSVNHQAQAMMLHLATTKENFVNFYKYFYPFTRLPENFKFKSVLMIGSKSPDTPGFNIEWLKNKKNIQMYDKESSKLFEMIEDIFKRFNPTIFQGHSNANTVSNYIYDVKNDTYYINTMLDICNSGSNVKNFDDLKGAFDRVEISPEDTVEFIV